MSRCSSNVHNKLNNNSRNVHSVMPRFNSKEHSSNSNKCNKDRSKEEQKHHNNSNKEVAKEAALKEEGHQEVAEDRLISPDENRDFFIY
jgi:hypothetical protein